MAGLRWFEGPSTATLLVPLLLVSSACVAGEGDLEAVGRGAEAATPKPSVCHTLDARARLVDPSVGPLYANDDPAFRVIAFGASPPPASADFPLYPATAAATFSLGTLAAASEDPAMDRIANLWGNRCVKSGGESPADMFCLSGGANDKGNPWDFVYLPRGDSSTDSQRIWAYFNTGKLADECTELQAIYTLGRSSFPAARVATLEGDLQVVKLGPSSTWASLRAATQAIDWYETLPQATRDRWANAEASLGNVAYPKDGDRELRNACVVRDDEAFPSTRQVSPVIDGLLVDYEVADGRSTAQTKKLFRLLRARVQQWKTHRHKALALVAYLNPLNRSASLSGVTADDARELLGLLDVLPIHEDHQRDLHGPLSASTNIEQQLDIVRGTAGGPLAESERRKIVLVYEMARFASDHYKTRLGAAREARRKIIAERLGGVFLWKNGMDLAQGCASDEWRAFACITLGDCGQ